MSKKQSFHKSIKTKPIPSEILSEEERTAVERSRESIIFVPKIVMSNSDKTPKSIYQNEQAIRASSLNDYWLCCAHRAYWIFSYLWIYQEQYNPFSFPFMSYKPSIYDEST